MELKVDVVPKAQGVYVIQPTGSLNSSTFTILDKEVDAVLATNPNLLVLDLEHLEYLSSAGLRVILKAREALRKNNAKLVFMNLQPQIRKVFDIVSALPSMQIFKNIEELDDYLDVMQKKVKSGADPDF
jgi:anti-anti-sigma factor